MRQENQGLQGRVGELQGRVGELEREKETLEQRVAGTENRNQELNQNMANMQTENAQMAQRIRAIELEEDAKRVDQLRDEYINSGCSRLGGGIAMSTLLSPLFFGSTVWNAVALGLSAVNPSTIPLLALGTVGTGTVISESRRASRQSDLEHYEREYLNRNPNATKREAFEYALRRIKEKEEEEAKEREEQFRREREEELRREQEPFAEYACACSSDLD